MLGHYMEISKLKENEVSMTEHIIYQKETKFSNRSSNGLGASMSVINGYTYESPDIFKPLVFLFLNVS